MNKNSWTYRSSNFLWINRDCCNLNLFYFLDKQEQQDVCSLLRGLMLSPLNLLYYRTSMPQDQRSQLKFSWKTMELSTSSRPASAPHPVASTVWKMSLASRWSLNGRCIMLNRKFCLFSLLRGSSSQMRTRYLLESQVWFNCVQLLKTTLWVWKVSTALADLWVVCLAALPRK